MAITVQTDPETAQALHRRSSSSTATELSQLIRRYDGRLEPMHPGATDSQLQSFFLVEISEPSRAAELMEQLRRHPSVLAAYEKPAEGLP